VRTRCSRTFPDGVGRRHPERPQAPPDPPAELWVSDGAGPARTGMMGVRIPPPPASGDPVRLTPWRRLRWWFRRPSPEIQAARLAGGLCPRCGSPDHLPVVYGWLADREALSRKYPEGFVAGGCYVESVEDPGPDRSCRRCGRRFRSGGPPAEIWLGAVVRGGPGAESHRPASSFTQHSRHPAPPIALVCPPMTRSCHSRATSKGQSRSPADSHGQSRWPHKLVVPRSTS
jgi:hypothetical protein